MDHPVKAVGLLAIVAELQERHPEWTAWEVAEVAHKIAKEQQEKALAERTKEEREAAAKTLDEHFDRVWKKKAQRRAEKMAASLLSFSLD